MSKIKRVVSNNLFALSFLIKYVPVYVVFAVIIFIANGFLQSVSNVWLAERVIDGIAFGGTYLSIAYPIIGFCAYALVLGLASSWFNEIFEKISKQRFSDRFKTTLYKKAAECDIKNYDNTEFYNDYVWSVKEIDQRAFDILQSMLILIQRMTVIVSSIVMMAGINSLILLVVILSCVINFTLTVKQNKLSFKLVQLMNPLNRKMNYIGKTIPLPEYAKEFRTSKIGDVLFSEYDKTVDKAKDITKENGRVIWKYSFLNKLLGENVLLTLVSVIVLSYQVLTGKTTIGGFVASYNGIQIIHSGMSFILSQAALFSEYSMYIERFKKFWQNEPGIKSKTGAETVEDTNSLSLDSVYFSYDSNKKLILDGISLDMKRPQKIAIVGSNGAGKSTLVKLLLRLYDADKGAVRHNGTDIRELDLSSYRDSFSCLFQDFNIYACSLGENISMSPVTEHCQDKLEAAIHRAGLDGKYESLSRGLDTVMTREFNDEGVILSGGEKQKLAMARVLYKSADCCILDEPTSALDPYAEAEFNKEIMRCSDDRLLIIISHRMTVTRLVDRIIVLDGGQICEMGSHEELMRKNGRYAKMFNMQAEQYKI